MEAYNIYEAARAAGVERVIFASSHHVLFLLRVDVASTPAALVRPRQPLRLTKAFGEQAGALFADKYGLRVLCIRIGYVDDKPIDRAGCRSGSAGVTWRNW